MNIIIYSNDPKIESKILKVDGRKWKFLKYININDKNLPLTIYEYIKYVLKRRWLEVEEYIIKDPQYACLYAIEFIKGRWPEAEETIKKDPCWSYEYARFVIR